MDELGDGAPAPPVVALSVGDNADSQGALRSFFNAAPASIPWCIVVFGVAGPETLSGKVSGLPVQRLQDGARPEAGTVLWLPAGHGAELRGDRFSVYSGDAPTAFEDFLCALPGKGAGVILGDLVGVRGEGTKGFIAAGGKLFRDRTTGEGSHADLGVVLAADRIPQALGEVLGDARAGFRHGFYADYPAFETLSDKVLAPLVSVKGLSHSLRIWVPDCGSGEDAYTIALEVSEMLRRAGVERKFRVIATDARLEAIERASAGVFEAQALERVPEESRDRYFRRAGAHYLVEPPLRQHLIFSRHDVLRDPPFLNLDLICCRSILSGLAPEARTHVISMFVFGLRLGGGLLLGAGDSLGPQAEAFEPLDARWRLFRKKSQRVDGGVNRGSAARADASVSAATTGRERELLQRASARLLQRHVPPSLLLTGAGGLLDWFGMAETYVNAVLPAKGATLEQGLHRDLHAPLRAGLDVILSGGREVWESETEVALSEEETHRLSLRLERLDGRGRDAVLLLSMIRIPAPAIRVPQLVRAVPPSVERDLSRARDQLQQAEARLRANTEAFRATNAQLRLMYEDLLRSHQDLHAVNQELVAVSAENERRIETLSERNREMDLALTGMQAGLIVLDEDLRLCRFNSLAGQILGLERQDIFQRIGALGARLDLPELAELARQAAERNGPAERSCRFRSGVLSVLALPSGPAAGGRSGPVLVFTLQQPSQNLAAG